VGVEDALAQRVGTESGRRRRRAWTRRIGRWTGRAASASKSRVPKTPPQTPPPRPAPRPTTLAWTILVPAIMGLLPPPPPPPAANAPLHQRTTSLLILSTTTMAALMTRATATATAMWRATQGSSTDACSTAATPTTQTVSSSGSIIRPFVPSVIAPFCDPFSSLFHASFSLLFCPLLAIVGLVVIFFGGRGGRRGSRLGPVVAGVVAALSPPACVACRSASPSSQSCRSFLLGPGRGGLFFSFFLLIYVHTVVDVTNLPWIWSDMLWANFFEKQDACM